METIIDRVVAGSGRYEGSGDGRESGPFRGVIELRPLLDGLGAVIEYTATALDDTVLHTEHTTLALDMWSGEPTLYVLCAELAGLCDLVLVGEHTFDNGRGTDSFEVRIELRLEGDRLDYVWSWAAPGEELLEQSRATLTRVDP